MIKFIKTHWALSLIIALAAVFRFWQISTLPGGLFPDEAAYGMDARSILNGSFQPFFERGNGREGLFMYLLAAGIWIFGYSPMTNHLVSATLGLLTVLATYFLAKDLFGKQVGLLSAFFLSVSGYAVSLTRTAFRANTAPLFAVLTLFFLVKTFQAKNPKHQSVYAALAGASFGLGFYTYISFRMMVPLLIFFAAILLFANRSKLRNVISRFYKSFLIFLGAFVVFFLPLGHYFYSHPGSFVGRAGQVSIFSKDLNQGDVWGTFLQVFNKTIVSFFRDGDLNWRHNISGEPFLSPLLSLLFGIALVAFSFSLIKLLKESLNKKVVSQTVYKSLIAGWFWLMLVPEITTAEGIPHGLRLIGVIPAIFILPAWFSSKIWVFMKTSPLKFMYNTKYVLAVFFLGTLFFSNFMLYFDVAANSPDHYEAFRSDLTVVSRYLNQRANKSQTFLSLDDFSVQTVDYLTTVNRQPYTLLDPANTYKASLKSGDQVVFTQSTIFDRKKFVEYHPDAKLVRAERNKFGEFIMLVYEKP